MRAKRPSGFLNVDLEVVSRSKLALLEAGFSKAAHALHSAALGTGVYLLSLESNRYPKDADSGIVALCDAVEELGRAERRLWDRALSRTFDVGYSLESKSRLVQVVLRPATLKRVVALRATVAFSCYRGVESDKTLQAPAGQPGE